MEGMMEATRGDRISVVGAKTGSVTREGEILEVIEGELHVRYRVQWTDGHEAIWPPVGSPGKDLGTTCEWTSIRDGLATVTLRRPQLRPDPRPSSGRRRRRRRAGPSR